MARLFVGSEDVDEARAEAKKRLPEKGKDNIERFREKIQ